MKLSWRQLAALVLVVVLPLVVTLLAAIGLRGVDRAIENIAEEYGETRMLDVADRSIAAASFALGSDDQRQAAEARMRLDEAEVALVQYLGDQYESVATADHQAAESSRAVAILEELRAVIELLHSDSDRGEVVERVRSLRGAVAGLQSTADVAVRSAHDSAREARHSALRAIFAASLASTAVCVVLLVLSTRSVNGHLGELQRRLAALAPGPPIPAAPGVSGKVAQIEDLSSRLAQRVEASGRELLRRERLAGIGLLAADVAHEINNPMNAMLGLSELGLRTTEHGPLDEASRAELHESLSVIRREALRCRAIVDRLMAMVRSDRTSAWFDATRLARETMRVAQAARPDKAGCFVCRDGGVAVRAHGPADDVRQILLTLLVNAADAIGPDGRIEIDATQTEDEVWLRVRDDGRGFTEAMKREFFTPFRSMGEEGRGMGVGLSIAQALAEGMGASLRPFSEGPGKGSLFVLALKLPGGAA